MAAVEIGTPKSFRAGTHRLIPPGETVERMRPLLPRMGITRIANVTGLDCIGIPVVIGGAAKWTRHLRLSGKGADARRGPRIRRDGVRRGVRQDHSPTPPWQFRGPTGFLSTGRCNKAAAENGEPVQLPPPIELDRGLRPVAERTGMGAVPAWFMSNYTLDPGTETGNFAASSNGLASGNHLLEAMSHGICEVVERDCTALWKVAGEERRNPMRIDLDTVDDPGCRQALEAYERAGVRVAVWESTTELGLAAFECLIVDRAAGRLRDLYPAGGSGCHPVREIALLRALTEAARSRVTYISGARDDAFRADYERHSAPDAIARLRPLMDRPATRTFHAAPSFQGETFEEDVAWELKRLREAGIERAIVFDLSMPEFGVSVVRVVIPDLELFGTLPGVLPGRRVQAIMRSQS